MGIEEEKQSFISRVGKPWIVIVAIVVICAIVATAITAFKALTSDTTSTPPTVSTENTGKPVQSKGTQENLEKLSDFYVSGDFLSAMATLPRYDLGEMEAFHSIDFTGTDGGNTLTLTRQPFPYIQETAPNGMQYMHVEGLGPYFISDEGIPCGYAFSALDDNARMLQAINYTLLMYQAKTVDEKKAIIEVYTDMHLDGEKIALFDDCTEDDLKARNGECVKYGKTYESVWGRELNAQLDTYPEAFTVKKDDYYPALHILGFSMEKDVQENDVDGNVYSVFFKFGNESAIYRSDYVYPTIHLGNDESGDVSGYLHPISGIAPDPRMNPVDKDKTVHERSSDHLDRYVYVPQDF